LFTFVGASRGHLCDSTAFLLRFYLTHSAVSRIFRVPTHYIASLMPPLHILKDAVRAATQCNACGNASDVKAATSGAVRTAPCRAVPQRTGSGMNEP